MRVNEALRDEKARLPAMHMHIGIGAKRMVERFHELSEQFKANSVLARGKDDGEPNLVLYRAVTVLSLSSHAAVHMTDWMMDIAKVRIDRQSFWNLKEVGGIRVKEGETLGHFTARKHVEYAISLLEGQYLEGESNDYKRQILALQNSDGITVRQICMAKVAEFLRRTRDKEEVDILV
jgi:hypothetical protein